MSAQKVIMYCLRCSCMYRIAVLWTRETLVWLCKWEDEMLTHCKALRICQEDSPALMCQFIEAKGLNRKAVHGALCPIMTTVYWCPVATVTDEILPAIFHVSISWWKRKHYYFLFYFPSWLEITEVLSSGRKMSDLTNGFKLTFSLHPGLIRDTAFLRSKLLYLLQYVMTLRLNL